MYKLTYAFTYLLTSLLLLLLLITSANKCIWDNTKGPPSWSPNCIWKTKMFYGTPLSENSVKNCFPHKISLKSGNRLLNYDQKWFLIWRPSTWLSFRNSEFMSRDLYRHIILLPYRKFHWNRTIGCWVMAKNDLLNGGRPPSWILKIFIFCHLAVTEFQICCCVPNWYQNQMILRWDMAISRFSSWLCSKKCNIFGLMGSSGAPLRNLPRASSSWC